MLYCTVLQKGKCCRWHWKKEKKRENIAAQAATASAPKHKLKCAHAHFSDKCSSIEEIYCISGSMATFLFLHLLSIANCRRVGIRRVRCERVRICILSLARLLCVRVYWLWLCVFVVPICMAVRVWECVCVWPDILTLWSSPFFCHLC